MASGRSTRTLRRTALTFTGVAVGILVVGIALALVTIQLTGSVSSNEFIPPTTTSTSTTTTIPPGDGLEAAFVSGNVDCAPGIPSGALILGTGSFDLNNTFAQLPPLPNLLCVRNAGPGDIGTLTISVTATTTGEADCSTAEGAVDPEGASCGSEGELDDVLQVLLDPEISEDGNCSVAGQLQVPLGSPVSLLSSGGGDPTGALQPFNRCTWRVSLILKDTATDDQKLAASTDTAELTFAISGSA